MWIIIVRQNGISFEYSILLLNWKHNSEIYRFKKPQIHRYCIQYKSLAMFPSPCFYSHLQALYQKRVMKHYILGKKKKLKSQKNVRLFERFMTKKG